MSAHQSCCIAVVLYAHLAMTTSTLGRSFARIALIVASLLLASGVGAPGSRAHADTSRTVDLGTVDVTSPAPEAYREAMRIVLLRLTGRRAATTDAALQPLVESAERYVQIFQPATTDASARVTLDDLAVERALDELGEPVWPRERPVVLGVILSAPIGADPSEVREALVRSALERGLPLELAPASAVGLAPGSRANAGEALAAARRAGASAALIAESQGDRWSWTLFQSATAVGAVRFEGGVTAGVEGAADTLALGSQAMSLQPVSEVELIVTGVADLATHGAARRALANLVAIKNIELLEATARELRFRVQVSGGLRGLSSALDNDPMWQRESGSTPLRYRWVSAAGTSR